MRKFCDANCLGFLVQENPSLKLPSSRSRRRRRSIRKSQSRPFCAGANYQAQTIHETGVPLGMRVSDHGPRDLAPFGPVKRSSSEICSVGDLTLWDCL